MTLADFTFALTANLDEPVAALQSAGKAEWTATSRNEGTVQLWGFCPEEIDATADFPRIEKRFVHTSGVSITSAFWYPPAAGPEGGYTAPLVKWDHTTIEGLTTSPIELRGYYSQTHAPNHHNAGGMYIFEPRLEPTMSAATLTELEQANIQYILAVESSSEAAVELWVLGLNGELRPLP
jgi:hypothetical protein